MTATITGAELERAGAALAAESARFAGLGWMRGTSGNLSVTLRSDPLRLAVTASGRDKGLLRAEDVVVVDADGAAVPDQPRPGQRPSAEAGLHARIARVRVRPGGYNAERTPMDLPISRAVLRAVQSTTEQPVVAVPTLGGSLPLSIISEALGTRTLTVPIVNHDNNQHAEDENLRLQNLWDGIETMVAVMTMER